jgi:hypothetical protein
LGLSEFIVGDRFRADEFEKNIDRNLKQARLAWQAKETDYLASLNDRVREKYSDVFDDPTRMP